MSDVEELLTIAARLRQSDPAAAAQIEQVLARMAESIKRDPLAWRHWNWAALKALRNREGK